MTNTLIFAAHHDDEVIGCTSRILRDKNSVIVYVTMPSEIRKSETQMMALFAGLKKDNLLFLEYKASDLLNKGVVEELKTRISKIIKKYKPKEVYVPAYEGGNFFHDITNYAVNKAVENDKLNVDVYEFTTYNNYPKHALQKIARRLSWYMPIPHKYPQRFIPIKGKRIIRVKMSKEEMVLKKRMLRIYRSENKNDILVKLFWYPEKYRINIHHDYKKKPHIGPLNYELTTKFRFKDFQKIIE